MSSSSPFLILAQCIIGRRYICFIAPS